MNSLCNSSILIMIVVVVVRKKSRIRSIAQWTGGIFIVKKTGKLKFWLNTPSDHVLPNITLRFGPVRPLVSQLCQIGAATGESLRTDVFFASPVPDHYVQTWRRPQNRKYITYRNATEKNRATALGNLHKKLAV